GTSACRDRTRRRRRRDRPSIRWCCSLRSSACRCPRRRGPTRSPCATGRTALKPVRCAAGTCQLTTGDCRSTGLKGDLYGGADPLDRRAPRAAPARLKADSPVRMLITHELTGRSDLAAFFVFQPRDIAGDAVVSELVRCAEAHPGVLRVGIGSG